MKALEPPSLCFEFCFPESDTLVQVVRTGDEVEIRATRDTFGEQGKRRFIRQLAAEGFIPDHYRWFNAPGPIPAEGVQWRVDYTWLRLSEEARRTARRFMFRLFAVTGLLWLGLMAALLAGTLQPGPFFVATKSAPAPYSPPFPPAAVGPRGLPLSR